MPQSTRHLNPEGAKPGYANMRKLWLFLYGEKFPLQPVLSCDTLPAVPTSPVQPEQGA